MILIEMLWKKDIFINLTNWESLQFYEIICESYSLNMNGNYEKKLGVINLFFEIMAIYTKLKVIPRKKAPLSR